MRPADLIHDLGAEPGLVLVRPADGEDEEGAVAHPRQQAGVGDGEQRWGVEDDEVVLGEVVDERVHPLRAQELARVGRGAPGR